MPRTDQLQNQRKKKFQLSSGSRGSPTRELTDPREPPSQEDDEEVRVQLADQGAATTASRMHVRSLDGGKGQHGAGAQLRVQGRRIRVLHLLAERGKGESPLFGHSFCSPSEVPQTRVRLDTVCPFYLQDGDVIELCQVSDIRAGGLPKVSTVWFRLGYSIGKLETS